MAIFSDPLNERSCNGELAQMVERPLSMREVPGSMPGFSTGDQICLCSELKQSEVDFFFVMAQPCGSCEQ